MKTIFLFRFFSFYAILLMGLSAATAQSIIITGPMHNINRRIGVESIGKFAKDKSGNIYATTNKGLYKSSDHGVNWKFVALEGENTLYLCFDSNDHILTGNYSLLLSLDKGMTWQDKQKSFGVIATDKFGSLFGWAGNYLSEFWKSTDGGSNWLKISTTHDNELLVIDTSGDLIAANSTLVSISSDQGFTWTSHAVNGNDPLSAIYTSKKNTFYVGTRFGAIYTSSDIGITWQKLFYGDYQVKRSIISDDKDSSIVATGDRTIASSDGGRTWKIDYKAGTANCLVRDTGNLIHLGTTAKGIWDSYDFGQTWEQHGYGAIPLKSYSLAEDPTDSTIFMGTSDGIYSSNSTGIEWSKYSTFLNSKTILSMVIPTHNSMVIAVNDTIHRTVDAGNHWTSMFQQGSRNLRLIYDSISYSIFAYDSTGNFFRSIDSGLTWISVGNVIPVGDTLTAIATHGQVIIGTKHGLTRTSLDNGNSWSDFGTPIPAPILCLSLNSKGIYAGAVASLYLWDSTQHSWSRIYFPANHGPRYIIENQKNELFIFTDYAYLFGSFDGHKWGVWESYNRFEDFNIFHNLLYGVDSTTQLAIGNSILILGVGTNLNQTSFSLTVNPNPIFNQTTVSVHTGKSELITLDVYDLLGNRKEVLAKEALVEGKEDFHADFSSLPAGSYFVRLASKTQVRYKLIIIEK